MLSVKVPTPAVIILSQAAADTVSQTAAEDMKFLPIGFYVIDKNGDTMAKGAFSHGVEIIVNATLSPVTSPYLVIPCTFEPNQLGKFNLMVLTPDTPVYLADVNTLPR